MRYVEAKQLHNEDEVTVKGTGRILSVISTRVLDKAVLVLCSDGNTYHHCDVK